MTILPTLLKSFRNGLRQNGPYLDVQWGNEVDGAIAIWSAAKGTYVPALPAATNTFIVAPGGSIANAQAACAAAGGGTVQLLPGSFTEALVGVATVSVRGSGQYVTTVAGDYTAPASGSEQLSDLMIKGTCVFAAGNSSVFMDRVIVTPMAAGNAAVRNTAASSCRLIAHECTFDGRVSVGHAVDITASTTSSVDMYDCSLLAGTGMMSLKTASKIHLVRCELNSTVSDTAGCEIGFTDCFGALIGSPLLWLSGSVGGVYTIHGRLLLSAMSAIGDLWNSVGILNADYGSHLGSWPKAHLPALTNGAGAVVWCPDLLTNIAPLYFLSINWRRFSDNTVAT